MECGYAICCTFLPGDRHIVVGTKSGELLLYDLSSSSLLESFPAHTGPLWSLHVRPDGRGLVTGSADKDVKFWDFEVKQLDNDSSSSTTTTVKVLTLSHTKTLKMTDDVLAVKYSPDGKLLCVSLLDSTVKVFFSDTLKFFLSLYGHKLPVLSLDISYDSKLIITCSADKNIKIWGLDFGDCHRSLFAHDESVMQVAFERGSHLFWSVGKDKMVKYWDGDKFECIQKLSGHSGEVWALAVSYKANFVVTGSHDKSIRIWEKTDEPVSPPPQL
jgi:U3 small nucleolar RNA-associated protein 12